MQKQTPIQVEQQDANGDSQITIGGTVFIVNVHFGKIPLEDILRQRIVRESVNETG